MASLAKVSGTVTLGGAVLKRLQSLVLKWKNLLHTKPNLLRLYCHKTFVKTQFVTHFSITYLVSL